MSSASSITKLEVGDKNRKDCEYCGYSRIHTMDCDSEVMRRYRMGIVGKPRTVGELLQTLPDLRRKYPPVVEIERRLSDERLKNHEWTRELFDCVLAYGPAASFLISELFFNWPFQIA